MAVGLMVVDRGNGPKGAAHTVAAPGEHVPSVYIPYRRDGSAMHKITGVNLRESNEWWCLREDQS